MKNAIKTQSGNCPVWLNCLLALWGLIVVSSAVAGTVASTPLFLTNAAKPIAMLNISRDHQLYFKAFDDYSDLDNDGLPDTTYKNSIDYYGYFDSYKCYNYSAANKRFEPVSINTDKYCSGNWSGNFLNWSTMTRIDVVRKILYGGYRQSLTGDTATETVLERSYLPNDAHSIAKFYNGADLNKLTPFTSATGITLCSTTISNTQYSQNVTDPPKILIAKGDYSLWSAGEGWQCRWYEDNVSTASNGNTTANKLITELNAGEFSPKRATEQLGGGDLVARVQVCASNALVGKEQCKNYNGTLKPIGLLQTYGDEGQIRFGLMTGSYGKNTNGGVLRKNVGPMTNEINTTTDGTFKAPPATGGIINTLNKLRIYGFSHTSGSHYFDGTGGDNCNFTVVSLTDGTCTNWGNPQSEILLESLRYLAGKGTPSTAFNVNDGAFTNGLPQLAWQDPISANEWCANINVIQFNASLINYDADKLTAASEVGITDLNAATNKVGDDEQITGNPVFVGSNGVDNNYLCTAKSVSSLSAVRGICPTAPRQLGSYQIAGLAYGTKINTIRVDLKGDQKVTTYGVALSPALPQMSIPVPGSASKKINILPACQNLREGGRCTLVDFKIIYQKTPTTTATTTCPTVGANCGKFYVNWETAEQGGDFDMDMLGVLSYEVTATTVKITTDVFNASTGAAMGFGYVINGTTKDGFHAHSGHSGGTPGAGYIYNDPTGVTGCYPTKCDIANPKTSVSYSIGTSSANNLEQPLFYAAKWGGFIDTNGTHTPDKTSEWDANKDGKPDRYFAATNPQQLATSLGEVFADVLRTPSSASSVATNSTQFQTNTLIYQATFNSTDWSGHLLAYSLTTEDVIIHNGVLDSGEDTNGNGKLDAGGIGSVLWDAGRTTEDSNGNGVLDSGEDDNGNTALDPSLIPSAANRHIFSYDPTGPLVKGIEFLWPNLTDTQKQVLDMTNIAQTTSPILDYLRGDQSNELKVSPTGIYRTRSNLLGDIINSDPLFVGRDDFGYSGLAGSEGDLYASYVSQNRRAMMYVGSNDGMLHGFDANIGTEIFAYLPNAVISPELVSLTLPNYTHKYFVDGSPQAADAFFNNAWHTVLVGTMGAGSTTETGGANGVGGRAVFALDVSNPDSFSDGSAGRANVLWEFSSRDDNDLGYTLTKARIVKMANGQWAAIVGNGFNSVNGKAVLYVINIQDGSIISKIVADGGSGNGLASPVPIDADNDLIVDYIYAGDLKGNVWKFDVSGGGAGSWGVAFGGSPLFTAMDTAGTPGRQPITEKLAVVKATAPGQTTGYMVYFGSGKYYEIGDNVATASSQIQTFYGIWDDCDKTNIATCLGAISGRGELQQQSILFEGPSGFNTIMPDGSVESTNIRIPSTCQVAYDTTTPTTTTPPCTTSTNRRGWYMDLIRPGQPAQGELSASEPVVRGGRIIFATTIPINETCVPGGTGWIMELDQFSGGRLSGTPFDVNGDGKIDALDLATFNGEQVASGGLQSNVGIVKTPTIVNCETGMDCKYMSGTSGDLMVVKESSEEGGGYDSDCPTCIVPHGKPGRNYWRQLR